MTIYAITDGGLFSGGTGGSRRQKKNIEPRRLNGFVPPPPTHKHWAALRWVTDG